MDNLSSARSNNAPQYACPRCRAKLNLSVDDGRCPACGLKPRKFGDIFSFVDQPEQHKWQKVFEAQASGPDGDSSSAVSYRFPIQHKYIIDGFRRACISIASDARVLDAGCGNGIFWEAVFGTPNVIGVDFSLSMCKLARARGMTVHHADALALPFAQEQFDLVYSAEVLQCIDDLPVLLSEFARVCRPGGLVAVSTPNSSSALRRIMRATRSMRSLRSIEEPINRLRTAEDVASAAQGMPLIVDSVWWTHFPFGLVYRTNSVQYSMQSLASNVIVRFLRTGV